jgi:predicted esterase
MARLVAHRTVHWAAPRALLGTLLCVLLVCASGCGGSGTPDEFHPYTSLQTERGEIMVYSAFSDVLYGGPQLYPKSTTLEAVNKRLLEMLLPTDYFFAAYSKLEILEHSRYKLEESSSQVLSVSYRIRDRFLLGHAYFKSGGPEPGEAKCAALIIPGSGLNQSTGIYKRDHNNYHYDIAGVVGKYCDVFVYVKPNEDFLAIHNGPKKLGRESIVNYLINNGGSYSSLYLVHALAIVKHLRAVYDKVVVVGLSQGGKAAMLNALQSHPDGAVVASGFSIFEETFARGGQGQILIPRLNEYYGIEKALEIMKQSRTKYLFTYGLKDSGVLYQIEARERCTCIFFKSLGNVTCLSHEHPDGHKFPERDVEHFLASLVGD